MAYFLKLHLRRKKLIHLTEGFKDVGGPCALEIVYWVFQCFSGANIYVGFFQRKTQTSYQGKHELYRPQIKQLHTVPSLPLAIKSQPFLRPQLSSAHLCQCIYPFWQKILKNNGNIEKKDTNK